MDQVKVCWASEMPAYLKVVSHEDYKKLQEYVKQLEQELKEFKAEMRGIL